MELWDLYNEKRELIGKTHVRGEKIPDGYYHLAVHVWIRNSKGEYLIGQRSADRSKFPLMWGTVGGSAIAGENSITAAIRETKEEVGIDLDIGSGRLAYSIVGRIINGVKSSDIMDAWLFEYDGEADLSLATTAEVVQIKWMSTEEIKKLFEEKKLVHTLEYFFTVIEDNQ